eukprot:TRINITY_DN1283_c0_g2_i1.p1 TRINITY_DN1283_c0_g2~~TRINITY_DN1283_c0_g2_i1.p1  ORF type:complete len:643 (+),score=144.17 TRINITY_DN1283_c0_g2_i1:109-1929(+)
MGKDEFRMMHEGGLGLIPHPELLAADPLGLGAGPVHAPPRLDPRFEQYLHEYAEMPQDAHFAEFEQFYGHAAAAGPAHMQRHMQPLDFQDLDQIYAQASQAPQNLDSALAEYEAAYHDAAAEAELESAYASVQQRANAPVRSVGDTLRAFIDASRNGSLMEFTNLPADQAAILSAEDKIKIRDRCSIMGRHLSPDEAFCDAQLGRLFESCQIEATAAYEDVYKRAGREESFDAWLDDYDAEFAEYEKIYGGIESQDWLKPGDPEGMAAVQNIEDLVRYLKSQGDPKFRNSKFVDFLGKMSSGEIALGEDGIVERNMYMMQHSGRNRYVDHQDPFAEGLELFANGMLPEAIEAFEAEVTRNPEHSNAWKHLGLAHAENDEDDKAVAALQQALKTDPENLDALINMSVSHANLLNHAGAIMDLRKWIETHWLYKAVPQPPKEDENGFFVSPHSQCVAMFTHALSINSEDADLHVALGVLFNLSADYPKAVEAFRNALKYRPDDYTLWNKLGATLANSSRSVEAVEAYKQCLQLKPTYVRGWTNMGISHTDQGNHMEAAEYYLGALSANPRALHVWGYLNALFHIMERPDLIDKAAAHNVNLFRDEFTF